jgi:hypothetical protein
MMVGMTITWSDCQSAVYPAQLAGIGVATRCKSALQALHSHRRILLLTHRLVDLNLMHLQWGSPLQVPAALFRIQSP